QRETTQKTDAGYLAILARPGRLARSWRRPLETRGQTDVEEARSAHLRGVVRCRSTGVDHVVLVGDVGHPGEHFEFLVTGQPGYPGVADGIAVLLLLVTDVHGTVRGATDVALIGTLLRSVVVLMAAVVPVGTQDE